MRALLHQRSLLSIDQITLATLEHLYKLTNGMIDKPQEYNDALKGRVVTALFYEPSTRTSSSFIAAVQRLGGGVVPILGVQNTSVQKGESFEHTIKVLSQYSDVIVMRHPDVGSIQEADKASSVPVINAGDGAGEHPTQALLDGYTIIKERGDIAGSRVSIVGDLKYSRSTHSLVKLLSLYDNMHINLVSPPSLSLPDNLTKLLKGRSVSIKEHTGLSEVVENTDVLYINRVQRERFSSESEYKKAEKSYIITPESVAKGPKDMIIMHALPIAGEVERAVDDDPRAVYFDQARYGMYVRMALLHSIVNS